MTLDKYLRLPLRTLKRKRIYYNQIEINEYLKQIEEVDLDFNSLDFAKKIVKTMPNIELTSTTWEAFKYTLNNSDINKESIRNLYSILSKEELIPDEREAMGDYYRKNIEFIQSGSSYFVTKVGPNPGEIDKYMDDFIEFINNFELDEFIKSQIISLYLVYIHPYPNVNGRMSVMLASWYLTKNNKFSYIVFNRIRAHKSSSYTKNLKSIYNHGNITPFLTFIIKETKNYLEKMKQILEYCKLGKIDDVKKFKVLEYLFILKNPNFLSLMTFNNCQKNFIPMEEMKSILSSFLEDDLIYESNGEYRLSIEKSYHKTI